VGPLDVHQEPERLIEGKVARKLVRRVVRNAKAARLLSNEHFSVVGTLIESWAAVKMPADSNAQRY
jgi:hypothetical protein